MEQSLSIQGNMIIYTPETRNQSIEGILQSRFTPEELTEKTLWDLHDPYLLAGMREAVARIQKAKQEGERVIVFWDYDVDGVTSTSLLVHLLKKLDFDVSYRLPHRVHDGYGIKPKHIDEISQKQVSLIITVDCGSRDTETIAYAREKNIDVIVTDHHSIPAELPPDAVAIINPKRTDCQYPFDGLAWAGVAYKLVTALAWEYMSPAETQKYLQESIDIAAIGTVADCMTLSWENRTIVKLWLNQLKKSRSKWIRRLIEDKIHQDLDADVFGFHIWPRLNAAGRMDSAYIAVNLLLNNSDSLDMTLATIESLNHKRKSLTSQYVDMALENICPTDNILIYDSPDIEHGIIGIVAGRITEKFNKPSIVLKDEGDILVASCRSPEYFSIIEILEKYSDSFIAYGWHKQAAWFSIAKKDFEAFRTSIVSQLNALDFSKYPKQIVVDKEIRLEDIGFSLIQKITQYKPYGIGNPKPLFLLRDFTPKTIEFLGESRDHLKFTHRYGFKIFAFWMGEYFDQLKKSKTFDVVCDVSEDYWNGQRGIMIKVVDIIIA